MIECGYLTAGARWNDKSLILKWYKPPPTPAPSAAADLSAPAAGRAPSGAAAEDEEEEAVLQGGDDDDDLLESDLLSAEQVSGELSARKYSVQVLSHCRTSL